MSRQEAVNEIVASWSQRDGEFCVSDAEHEKSERELVAALRALGVTDEELAPTGFLPKGT